jgi:diacylglycerol O-acyltransferase / wax synthase
MSDHLTPLDATFLELEQLDEGATMHIGGVMVFDPPPDGGGPSLADVRDNLAGRLVQLERYTQRLSSERTGGLSWPRWERDLRFDVANHVQHAALPQPGGDAELCAWAGDFFSHRLDRTRPLWEMALIEGLAGGRWALAHKTHHSLMHGVGSVGVATLLFDDAKGGAAAAAGSPDGDGSERSWHELLPQPAETLAELARTGAHAAGAGLHAALHPRETFEKASSLVELIVRDELTAAPHTSLNEPIGANRRFAIVRTDLDELKAIGHELGGSVNDVVLAACTAGLRQLLLSREEPLPPEGLRAMVPMNVRKASERLALGNRVSSLFVELPVAEADRETRLRKIAARTRELKSSGAATGASAMIDLAGFAPPILHAMIARSLYATRLFNVTITNVPGPQFELFGLGCRLREIHPLVPLAAHHSVGIAIFSYDGGVVFGLSADRDSTPDLDALRAGIEQDLQDLRSLCATQRSQGARSTRRERADRGAARRAADAVA